MWGGLYRQIGWQGFLQVLQREEGESTQQDIEKVVAHILASLYGCPAAHGHMFRPMFLASRPRHSEYSQETCDTVYQPDRPPSGTYKVKLASILGLELKTENKMT